MTISEITFNFIWNGIHKAIKELNAELKELDIECTEAKVIQNTIDELITKKENLEKIARDNNFSEIAFKLD